jgi:hypothetical protein
LQRIHGAAVGHTRVTVNHHVLAQALRIRLIAEQRQRDSPVMANVSNFLMHKHVADYEFLVFYSHSHGDQRTTV